MAAIIAPLEAARNVGFAATLYTEYLGDSLPIDGATVVMEIRQYPGQAGDPLASIADVVFSDGGQVGEAVDPADGVLKSVRQLVLEPVIPIEDIAALPGQDQPEAGDRQRFVYEIMLIYADEMREPLWAGDFFVSAGVVA